MIFLDVPDDIKSKIELFYGVKSYPPKNDTCVWKLLFSCDSNENKACVIQNSDDASFFLIAQGESLKDKDVLESDFDNVNLQIMILNPLECLIFSKPGMSIYKCIPKTFLDNLNHVSILKINTHILDSYKFRSLYLFHKDKPLQPIENIESK